MNVFPVALALVTPPPPVVQTKGTGGEWVKIGKNNDFFEQVIALKNGSPTLSRCINTRTRLVKGSGFVVDADKYPKLTAFLKQIKADKLLGSVAGDNATFRGRAYQVIWSKDGKGIAAIHYQRFKQVRSGKYDEDGNVNSYFLSRDWTAIGRQENKPVELMAFSKDADKKKPQLFYRYTESDNIEYYPDPEYWPAANYAQLEKDLSEFHLGNVQNRFTVNTILVTGEEPDAEEDETQQEANKKFEQALEKKFTGATGKNLMVMTG